MDMPYKLTENKKSSKETELTSQFKLDLLLFLSLFTIHGLQSLCFYLTKAKLGLNDTPARTQSYGF